MVKKIITTFVDRVTLIQLRHWILIGVAAAGVLAVAAYLFLPPDFLGTVRTWMMDLADYLKGRPFLLIAAICVLPGVGFPISPFLIAFGAIGADIWGIWMTCVIAILAVLFCSTWSYFVALLGFREFFTKLFESKKKLIPQMSQQNMIVLGVIIRLAPGLPFTFQNYFLGFIRMPFLTYFLISLGAQALYTVAFVTSGGAIMEGNFTLLSGAVVLIVILSIGTIRLRTYLLKKSDAAAGPAPGD